MEQVAIIGMGCRFPGGVKNPQEFWQLLRDGQNAIVKIQPSRWELTQSHESESYPRYGGLVENIDKFDADFFGISTQEAEAMDPHQRLVLECAWESLENAAINPQTLSGSKTGVFIGIGNYDYGLLSSQNLAAVNGYYGTGMALGITASRLSYLLNLKGPSLALETACSSSLVAIHYACQSLREGESDLGIVGAVNLLIHPMQSLAYTEAAMLSSDGRCKTFDADANGYARGEGCGIVVLKRLTDAIADGDNIQAIIRGSAVNQNGLTNGLNAPNGRSQQAVIRQALENAELEPAQISYVETHAIGTSVADAIEVKSIQNVLKENRLSHQRCWLGSVKTNIGHIEAASGMASLIKTVLALQHKAIPPNLHLQKINSYINLKNTPFSFPSQLENWETPDKARFAGVSSFGFGGTNAHAIISEQLTVNSKQSKVKSPKGYRSAYQKSKVRSQERSLQVLTLSAKNESALRDLVIRYKNYLQSNPDVVLEDLCFTANTGRADFNHRLAIIAASTQELEKKLNGFQAQRKGTGILQGEITSNKRPKIAFVFSGEITKTITVVRELYQTQPTFHKIIEEYSQSLSSYFEVPLLDIIYSDAEATGQETLSLLEQKALFLFDYALTQLWKSWGIKPDGVIGQGVGEYVAACVAGVFSLECGFKLINSQKAPKLETSKDKSVAFEVKYSPAKINLIDSRTGNKATKTIATPEYWDQHQRQSENLATGVQTLKNEGYRLFFASNAQSRSQPEIPDTNAPIFLTQFSPETSVWQQTLESLAAFYLQGIPVNWSGFDQDYPRQKLVLPTYPWQRSSYWLNQSPEPETQNGDSQKTVNLSRKHQLSIPKIVNPPQSSRKNQEHINTDSKLRTDKLIEWLRNYAAKRINSRLIDERRCIPPYIVLDFGNQGLLGLQVPEKYGGLNLTYSDTFRVFEQLAAIDLTLAAFVGVHHVLGTRPIMKYASETLREQLLPLLAQGRELAAFAITEPGAGSNPRAIATTAIPDNQGGWRLTGEKIWIGTGSWASTINVFAQMVDAQGKPMGMTSFVVRQDSQGLEQGPEALTMGMRGMVQNRIFLKNVVVRPEDLLGEIGNGLEVAQDAMMLGRLGLGAIALGGMKRCAQLMLRYSSRRSIATGRLLDNPTTLVRLSNLNAMITAVEALIFTTAQLLDQGCKVPEEIYTACKTSAPEFFWEAADQLVQLLGGRGYIETNLAPQILRDARLLRIFEGPTEPLNMFLGSRVINKNEELKQFLTEQFKAPGIAASLELAARKVKDHLTKSEVFFADRQTALRWTYLCTGEIATFAILLAAIQKRVYDSNSEDLNLAAVWAKSKFEQKLDSILWETPENVVISTAETITKQISDYTSTIGAIENTLAGEEQELDELLKLEVANARKVANFHQLSDQLSPLVVPPNSLKTQENSQEKAIEELLYTTEAIQDWLENWLAKNLSLDALAIDPNISFANYGMDSVMAVELVQDLEDWLEQGLDATLLWNFPTITSLAEHLINEVEKIEVSSSAVAADFRDKKEKILSDSIQLNNHDENFPASVATKDKQMEILTELEGEIAQELAVLEDLLGDEIK
ncbi:MAG: beta-ketoacyl synthase N-terminal-like domain-containing protein [Cyanobacteria bacterium P01_F01_bin.143]